MSTRRPKSPLENALAGIPSAFRSKLIKTYIDIRRNYAENRHEAAGLSTGKFCEVSIRLLQHEVTGIYVPFGTKISNFADECRKIMNSTASSVTESLRIVIPRGLVFMYTMRNKRGIGHVGGDIEANQIDSATVVRLADWVICELIRLYHSLPIEEAQDIIDSLADRVLPDVWEVGGKKRVLRKGLTAKQQTLLLLYSSLGSFVLSEDLFDWVEYYSLAHYKRDVLRPLHKERLVEYDSDDETVRLSPLGVKDVEVNLLSHSPI